MGLIDVVKQAQRLGAAVAADPNAGLVSLEPSWLPEGTHEDEEEENGQPQQTKCRMPCFLQKLPPAPADNPVKLRIEEEEGLSAALLQKLEAPVDGRLVFAVEGLLRPYLEKLSGTAPSLPRLLKKASPKLGRTLLGTIIRLFCACGYWDGVKSIIFSNALTGNTYLDLVPVLVEHDQVSIICVWLEQVRDPHFQDLSLVLKYFLKCSMKSSKGLAAVRWQWHRMASSAVTLVVEASKSKENVMEASINDDGISPAHKRASKSMTLKAIVLAAAFDQFQPYELCLHYFVASGHDDTVLLSLLSQLDTSEILRLLLYLEKWLKKYSRQSVLCASHDMKAGIGVPSLTQILQWVSTLVDVHFTTLILCTDFHVKLGSLQRLVKELVDAGYKYAPLVGITEHIRDNGLLPSKGIVGGEEDHVIEYLEI